MRPAKLATATSVPPPLTPTATGAEPVATFATSRGVDCVTSSTWSRPSPAFVTSAVAPSGEILMSRASPPTTTEPDGPSGSANRIVPASGAGATASTRFPPGVTATPAPPTWLLRVVTISVESRSTETIPRFLVVRTSRSRRGSIAIPPARIAFGTGISRST